MLVFEEIAGIWTGGVLLADAGLEIGRVLLADAGLKIGRVLLAEVNWVFALGDGWVGLNDRLRDPAALRAAKICKFLEIEDCLGVFVCVWRSRLF